MTRRTTLWMLALVAVTACGNDSARAPVRPPPPAAASREADASVTERAAAPNLPLVPRPRSASRCDGALAIDRTTRIAVVQDGSKAVAEQLARWLGLPTSAIEAGASRNTRGAAAIELHLESPALVRSAAEAPPRTLDEEAYTLDVSPTRAIVRARSEAGLFFGAQTLAQLAGARRIGTETPPLGAPPAGWSVPCVTIEDAPRFSFRAMHLDVARHFFGKDVVKRWVDLLAFYRFNVFHWHLTDDQGFRFEVKAHPELTAVGGQDGFYTHDDVRDVVEHARKRFVTVIPEIEMPGHARAILAAHPELSCTGKRQPVPRTWGIFDDVLCAGNEKSYALLGAVIDDVAAVFPSRLVHLGGDEVPKTRWSTCAKCRAAMRRGASGATLDAEALHGAFMQRIASKLATLGRRPLVWDEALTETLPRDAIVVAWQSRDRGRLAASQSHDVVMAPHDFVYFNIHQSRAKAEPGHEGHLPWTKVLAFDPVPDELAPERKVNILGGEGTVWTEYIETEEQLETMAMPRLAALAEVLWSGTPGSRPGAAPPTDPQQDFAARLRAQRSMLDASGVRYFVEPPVGLRDRKVFLDGETASVRIEPPLLFADGVVRWTTDGSAPTAGSPVFEGPVSLRETTSIAAALFLANGRSSPVVRSTFVKETPRAALAPASVEKGAECTYFEGDFRKLPDFAKLRPTARARAARLTLDEIERAFAGRTRKERFAVVCEALFEAPIDGVHRFIARADDGVRVNVDGELILEDDGEHEPRESEGEIALRQGHHRLRVSYFQGAEGKELAVWIEAPGRPRTPVAPVLEEAARLNP